MLSQLEMLADRVQISLETNVVDLSLLSRIDHLQSLNVHAAVTDLEPLRTMQNLQSLTLEGTKDTVLDLEPLAELKNPQFLCFADEQLVRDASVVSHVPMLYGIAEEKDW